MTTERPRSLQPADDAPRGGCAETQSSMLQRAASAGARHVIAQHVAPVHPQLAKGLRWCGGVAALLLTSGGTAAYMGGTFEPAPAEQAAVVVESRTPDCDPLIEQHLQHIARVGGKLQAQLELDGLAVYAAMVGELTAVDKLPDDLKLCLLLRNKRREKTQ